MHWMKNMPLQCITNLKNKGYDVRSFKYEGIRNGSLFTWNKICTITLLQLSLSIKLKQKKWQQKHLN